MWHRLKETSLQESFLKYIETTEGRRTLESDRVKHNNFGSSDQRVQQTPINVLIKHLQNKHILLLQENYDNYGNTWFEIIL